MNTLTKSAAIGVLFSTVALSAYAQSSYPAQLASDFTNWCTVQQGQPATVCSCAVENAATQIPAVAMASFLAAPEGAAAASVTSGVGATAAQVVTSCAAGVSPTAGAAIGAAGALGAGLLGK